MQKAERLEHNNILTVAAILIVCIRIHYIPPATAKLFDCNSWKSLLEVRNLLEIQEWRLTSKCKIKKIIYASQGVLEVRNIIEIRQRQALSKLEIDVQDKLRIFSKHKGRLCATHLPKYPFKHILHSNQFISHRFVFLNALHEILTVSATSLDFVEKSLDFSEINEF